jgi:hypothetical protein
MALDFFGRRINKDCVIAYPVRQGSSMWIEKGRVTEVLSNKLKIVKKRGVKTQIKNICNCIIAPPGTEL